MTDKKNDHQPFDEMLKDLQDQAGGFLKNLSAATSAQQERLAEQRQKLTATPSPSDQRDPFERVHDALLAQMRTRPDMTLPQHKEIEGLPEQKVHLHKNIPQDLPTEPASTSSEEFPGNAAQLIDSMVGLLTDMAPESALSLPQDMSWHSLDQHAGRLRNAWVGLIGNISSSANQVLPWMERWESILTDIQQAAGGWPQQYASTWTTWSQERSEELRRLQPLLSKLLTSSTILSVPKTYQGQGIIPAPSADVPLALVQALASCSDFWAYQEGEKMSIRWKTTPFKAAFDKARQQLEEWEPVSEQASIWKEQALDRYAVFEGKIALAINRSTTADPAPARRPATP